MRPPITLATQLLTAAHSCLDSAMQGAVTQTSNTWTLRQTLGLYDILEKVKVVSLCALQKSS